MDFFFTLSKFISISDKFARFWELRFQLQPARLDSPRVNKIYENNQGKNQNKDFNHIEYHFFYLEHDGILPYILGFIWSQQDWLGLPLCMNMEM